jgi:hypothetical protein
MLEVIFALKVCEKMQEKKRDVFNIAERRGGTLNVDDDDDGKPKVDWKQTRLAGRNLMKHLFATCWPQRAQVMSSG